MSREDREPGRSMTSYEFAGKVCTFFRDGKCVISGRCLLATRDPCDHFSRWVAPIAQRRGITLKQM